LRKAVLEEPNGSNGPNLDAEDGDMETSNTQLEKESITQILPQKITLTASSQ
jgi:hypothetical protein